MEDLNTVGWLWFSVPVLGSISKPFEIPFFGSSDIMLSLLHRSTFLRLENLDSQPKVLRRGPRCLGTLSFIFAPLS